MIRIWHDEALRWLPLWLTITMLNTSVLLGMVAWRQASASQNAQLPVAALLIILWLALAFYILFGQVRTRCQRLEMTLPIRSQTLWRRHLAAVFLAGAVVLAGSLVVLALHATLLSKAGRTQFLEIPYMALIGPLLAGLFLATTLVSSIEPGLQKLRGKRTYWALVLGNLVGIPLLLVLFIQWPWASTGICFVLAISVSRHTLRSLPAAYRLVPATAGPASAERTVAASTDQPASQWQVYRTLFTVLHTAPPWKQLTPWMVYGIGAVMGFILGGGINRWEEVASLRFLYLPIGSYMLFAGIGILTYNLYRLDSLPVSRRTILAVLMLPGLIAFSAGYATGSWARSTASDPSPMVDFKVLQTRVEVDLDGGANAGPRELETMVWVEVDSSFMGATLTGEPPTLTSPWGESHEAWSEELFKGTSALLYNPYNTSEETSADFEALMLSRAIEDIYGRSISPDELRDRYFVVEQDQVVGLRSTLDTGNERIPLLADYPALETPAKGPETPVYMLLVLVPWLLLTALFLSSFRATHSNRYIRGIYWVGLAIPMLGSMSQVVLAVFGLFSPDAGRAFLEILVRMLGSNPATWLLTWVIAIAIVLVCYRLALRQFERAEIPTSPINCSLVNWGMEE
jgi:hypothetical protein